MQDKECASFVVASSETSTGIGCTYGILDIQLYIQVTSSVSWWPLQIIKNAFKAANMKLCSDLTFVHMPLSNSTRLPDVSLTHADRLGKSVVCRPVTH